MFLFWVVDPLRRFCDFVIFNSDLSQLLFSTFCVFPFLIRFRELCSCFLVVLLLLDYRFGSCVSVLGLRLSVLFLSATV